MKNIYVILFLLVSHLSLAQEKNLVVEYQAQTTFENTEDLFPRNSSFGPNADMEKALRNSMDEIHNYKLLINKDLSSFEYQPKINNEQSNFGMRISFSAGDDWFIDLENHTKSREAQAVNGEAYLIQDSIENLDWKITREKKKVYNIDAQKATAYHDSVEYIAWYAPSIPLPHGPMGITGLPGLILDLKVSKPLKKTKIISHFWVAGLTTEENVKIVRPTKGQIISLKEFMELNDKLIEELNAMYSEGVDRD